MIVLICVIGAIIIIGVTALTVVLIGSAQEGGIINAPCNTISTTGLINAATLPCVVNNNDITTSDKLTVGYQPLAIITPNEYPYKTACATMCSRIDNGHCVTSDGTIDIDTDPLYQQCLTKLAPTRCIGTAMPVAYSGNTMYYVKSFYTDNVQTANCIQ